ncbi:DUF262 domain-containing protein [Frigoribacterium sp. CFBP 8754]|uniref:DUF262 domain-containing protein n=1 Tax=Frigoribacterium sp. CFBP 8754 TaxID=2775290 RepID=UPI001781B29F|nr:DUF262 domain-containing protein [Frigoribacterium sp. CFBP 8754]MBD8658884.1 DUF262 domain-containing protein [Frigoribacterium sp. CFBP 8754]
MKVESWDPDLETLYNRYQAKELDLQPSFQRGSVWPTEKQARLIDSLMRRWRVPPVHFIVERDETLSVLDGQQRLQAMFDFIDGKFAIQAFPPFSEDVASFSGLRYGDLPRAIQRRISSSRIPSYRLDDYEAGEPYELFFRLNLPTSLSQAEKRNALAGDAREQIRVLARRAADLGWDKDVLGFSDNRMAYDDVLSRVCVMVQHNAVGAPTSPSVMENAYRREGGFSAHTLQSVRRAVEHLTYELKSAQKHSKLRLNKATLLTWLIVVVRADTDSVSHNVPIREALRLLEGGRAALGRSRVVGLLDVPNSLPISSLVDVYSNRASLRVSDTLSIQARDVIAWIAIAETSSLELVPSRMRELVRHGRKMADYGPEVFENEFLTLLAGARGWDILR